MTRPDPHAVPASEDAPRASRGTQPEMELSRDSGGLFLGGPISALLLGIAFTSQQTSFERVLPWFCLVPLFISLWRHRDSTRRRAIHGLTFGVIFCALTFHSVFRSELAALAGSEDASTVVILRAVGLSAIDWGIVTCASVLFCVASGFLVRARSWVVPLLGLPVLWVGLETLRIELNPRDFRWGALGCALSAGNPEAQCAAWVGVPGLGFLVGVTNAAFFLTLRNGRWQAQLCHTASGIAVFCLLFVAGRASYIDPAENVAPKMRVGVIQNESGDPEEPLALARKLLDSAPEVLLFPVESFLGPLESRQTLRARLAFFAERNGVDVLAGLGLYDAFESTSRSAHAAERVATEEDEPSETEPLRQGRPRCESSGYFYFRTGNRRPLLLAGSDDDGLSIEPSSTVITTSVAKIGIAIEENFNHALRVRNLVGRGARALLIASRDTSRAGEAFTRLHLRHVAFRALENRIPLVRATLAGHSAFIDRHGKVILKATASRPWAVVHPIRLRREDEHASVFSSWGWIFGPISMGCAVGLLVAAGLRPFAQRQRMIT